MTHLTLAGSPKLDEVAEYRAIFQSFHDDAEVYYIGAVAALDADRTEYRFDGALLIDHLDASALTIGLLDGSYAWKVVPVGDYRFEFVASGATPSIAAVVIDEAATWPGWSPPRTIALPSAAAYQGALAMLRPSLTAGHVAMLRAQYRAPAFTITARELAAAAGYKNFNGANLQYGKLGKRLREALQFYGGGQEAFVLSMFYTPTEQHPEWRFVMHPPVIEALRQLGWFENAEM